MRSLKQVSLDDADLQRLTIHATDSMDFYGASLRRADLRDASLRADDGTGVVVSFDYTDFRDADLRAIDVDAAGSISWREID